MSAAVVSSSYDHFIDKPIPLNITEKNPARCLQAWLVFDTYRADVERQNPGVLVDVLLADDAQVFISAFNASAPVSTYRGDSVVLFKVHGLSGTLVSIVKSGCLQMAKGFPSFLVLMWRTGIVPPATPSVFPHNNDTPRSLSI